MATQAYFQYLISIFWWGCETWNLALCSIPPLSSYLNYLMCCIWIPNNMHLPLSATVSGAEPCEWLVWLFWSCGRSGDTRPRDNPPLPHPYCSHRHPRHSPQPWPCTGWDTRNQFSSLSFLLYLYLVPITIFPFKATFLLHSSLSVLPQSLLLLFLTNFLTCCTWLYEALPTEVKQAMPAK